MKTLRKLALMATLVAMTMMTGGCYSVTDISDRAAYDTYYGNSGQTPSQNQLVFDVPYKQFKPHLDDRCDTTPMVEALKTAYGADIAFAHSPSAYVVDVTDIKRGGYATAFNGYATKLVTVANFNGREFSGGYNYKLPWAWSKELLHEICYGSALEVAKQIKAITDAELAKK